MTRDATFGGWGTRTHPAMTLYAVLKLIHVLAVLSWIGGVATLSMITGKLVSAGDRATLAAFFPHAMAYGQRVAGPSSIVVLLTGIPMVMLGKIGFGTFWVAWGFAGIVLHFILGATMMRRRSMGYAQLVANPATDEPAIAAAGARLRIANLIYLLIMVSVIGAMVLKPVL